MNSTEVSEYKVYGYRWIVLLLFGATRLPEIARALGKSIKEFKKGTKEVKDELSDTTKEEVQ